MVCGTGAVGVETNENRVLNLTHPYGLLSYSKIRIIIAIAKDSDCFFVLLRFGYPHILFFISVWPVGHGCRDKWLRTTGKMQSGRYWEWECRKSRILDGVGMML